MKELVKDEVDKTVKRSPFSTEILRMLISSRLGAICIQKWVNEWLKTGKSLDELRIETELASSSFILLRL